MSQGTEELRVFGALHNVCVSHGTARGVRYKVRFVHLYNAVASFARSGKLLSAMLLCWQQAVYGSTQRS